MTQLHTLTVQDVLWINLQLTKKVHRFNHARLEEATFYQYGYGTSTDLIGQATQFLPGFIKMNPLEAGNLATAFVAFVTFLRMNGQEADLSDSNAEGWLSRMVEGSDRPSSAIPAVVKPQGHEHHDLVPNVRAIIQAVISDYPKTLAALLSEKTAAPAY